MPNRHEIAGSFVSSRKLGLFDAYEPAMVTSADDRYYDLFRLLKALHGEAPYTLTAIIPDGPTETFSGTVDALLKFLDAHNGRKNIYYPTNRLRGPIFKKASKTDVGELVCVALDLDPKSGESSADAKNRYFGELARWGLKPSIIVDSGNGLQLIFILAEPIALGTPVAVEGSGGKLQYVGADAEIVTRVEWISLQICLLLGGTAGTQNIDRIFRACGTVNLPNRKKVAEGRSACDAVLLELNDGRFELSELAQLAGMYDSGASRVNFSAHASNGGGSYGSAGNAETLFARLPADLQHLVAAGPFSGEDRSATAFSVINRLIHLNFSDFDIEVLFRAHSNGIGQRYVNGKDLAAEIARAHTKTSEAFSGSGKVDGGKPVLLEVPDPESVEWLWENHLPMGSLELMTGLPGLGKSQAQCSFIASVTNGIPWPDGTPAIAPQCVIMLTAEDMLAKTISPRLIAAGADRSKVRVLHCIRSIKGKNEYFLLSQDLDKLRIAIDTVRQTLGPVGLITIDPITSYLGSGAKFDSHKATDVRHVLSPLKDFAEEMNVTISAITHPPKSSSQRAIDHFIGSQAFVAAARVGHLIVPEVHVDEETGETDETGRALFTTVKSNVGKKNAAIAFQRELKFIEHRDPKTGMQIEAAYVQWMEEISITADKAIAAVAGRKSESKGQERYREIASWLMERLESGGEDVVVLTKEAEKRRWSYFQLYRASKGLVDVETRGAPGTERQSFWHLKIQLRRKE